MKFSKLVLALLLSVCATLEASAQIFTNIAYAKRSTVNPFYPDDTSNTYVVSGRITSPNLSTNRTEIYIQDTNDNIGIQILGGFIIDTNTFQLGYDVSAEGFVVQSNGVRSISAPNSFQLNVNDPTPLPPAPVQATLSALLAAAETNEGRFVEVTNVFISGGTWPALNSSATLTITDGTAQASLRIDADLTLDGQPQPVSPFTLRGIFTQFDTSTNANSGYQIVPRFYTDALQTIAATSPAITVISSNVVFGTAIGQPLTINVLGTDANAEDTLVFSITNGPSGATFTDTSYRMGRFEWTPGISDAGVSTSVTIEVTDGTFTGSVQLALYVLTEEQANIILNEFQFDPDGVLGDANNDGTNSTSADEFVEIVNNNTGTVDMTGYTLMAGTNMLFTFPATVLTGQTAVVVFGGGSPVGTFGFATVYASTNWSGLANSGSSGPIRLLDTNNLQIFAYDYTALTDDSNQSFTRNPDITGSYIEHLTANPAKRYSPGSLNTGSPFSGTGQTNTAPQITPIADTFARLGQSRVINLSASDNEGNPIALSMSGAPASASIVDNGNGTGTFAYTGLVADAGTDFNVLIIATDGNMTNSEAFRLSVPTTTYSGFLINEYLADPDASGGVHVDANNDGVSNNVQDEFVEIYNGTTGAVDVTGMRLFDGVAVRHVFTSMSIPSGGVIVVFGGGSLTLYTNGFAQTASTGDLQLNNTADSVILYSPSTQLLDRVDYLSAVPQAASITRNPDITGEFTNHFEATGSANRASPGRKVNGSLFVSNLPPVLASIGNKSVNESNTLSFAVSATDIDADTITLTISNAPSGSAFGSTNGAGFFIWTNATPAGVYTTSVFASDNDGVDSETFTITVIATTNGGGGGSSTGLVWINEFHYDNDLGDVNEGIEVAGQAGADLSAYKLFLYNFTGGLTYSPTTSLTGIITDEGCGYGAKWFPVVGLQNGPNDGIALVKDGTNVIQFLSYEGTLTANNGPALGMTSTDVGVFEPGTGYPTNLSLQLTGSGTNYANFTWTTNTFSMGTLNIGQTIVPCGGGGGNDDDGDGLPNDWETQYFGDNTNGAVNVDSDGDGFVNSAEFIALTDPTNSASYFKADSISNAAGRVVSFLTATGRSYDVHSTTNLLDGTGWFNVQTGLLGSGSAQSVTDTNTAPAADYRIGVKLQ